LARNYAKAAHEVILGSRDARRAEKEAATIRAENTIADLSDPNVPALRPRCAGHIWRRRLLTAS